MKSAKTEPFSRCCKKWKGNSRLERFFIQLQNPVFFLGLKEKDYLSNDGHNADEWRKKLRNKIFAHCLIDE